MATSGGGSFDTTVVLNARELNELLRGPSGPVYRAMLRFGDVVKEQAVIECPVYDPPDAYSAAHRDRQPGTLKRSIVKRVVKDTDGEVTVLVGSDDPITLWVHEGTPRHPIFPVRAKVLVFFWKKVGAVVGLAKVDHPGTQPNRFLLRALQKARGRFT